MKDTSWKNVGRWYGELVGEEGHYYHQHIILPNVLRLMKLGGREKVLDLGCGQGVLGRQMKAGVRYLGIDMAKNLIEEAERRDKNSEHKYIVGNIMEELPAGNRFDWAVMILSMQNVKSPFRVIRNTRRALTNGGRLLIVLNHPAFRIPKHSDWVIDKEKNKQYRKVDSYMSPLEIPIDSSPFDKKDNKVTFSYHYPLSAYSEMLLDNGFLIEKIEEWVSDKVSTGGAAKMENMARREFPLFMAIVACRRPSKIGKFQEGRSL